MKHLISAVVGIFFIILVIIAMFIQGNYLRPGPPKIVTGHVSAASVYLYKDLRGPADETVISPPIPTAYSKYSHGADSSLAVLLTSLDSQWLNLAHGLKAIGIPFIITRDYKQALQHKVVLVYPELSADVLPAAALQALAHFPVRGGMLIAQYVSDGLGATFGFKQSRMIQDTALHFNANFSAALRFTEPEEQTLQISQRSGENTRTFSYLDPTNTPLARYENGDAAMIGKSYPLGGETYAFGFNIGQLLARGYAGTFTDDDQKYNANHYQPMLDVLLRCLKHLYIKGQKNAVTLATVPDGKLVAVMLSHDLNYSSAVKNALDYAMFEQQQGIKASYFTQSKYVTDWNDKAFITPKEIKTLQQIHGMGMEIAGHTVAHSAQFHLLPLGTGKEQYPDYRPYIVDESTTKNATIFGEIRVGRFLLQHFFPDQPIVSFRSGGLLFPKVLPQALAATGYQYDSSIMANEVLTHLPFQLDYDRVSNTEMAVYEFPVTIEDEAELPLMNRLVSAVELVKKLSRYGGSVMVLIRPDSMGKKFEFETRLVLGINQALPQAVWYGTLMEFGNWWAARDQVTVAVTNGRLDSTVTITAPMAISGLTLMVLPEMRYISSDRADVEVTQSGQSVVVDHLVGQVKLLFKTD